MGALSLALVASLMWGTGDFVGGLMTKRLAPATVLLVSQAAGLAFMGVLVAGFGEPLPDGRYLLFGGLAGATGAIGLAALYKGLAVGRMSIVAPTAALSGAVPVAVGLVQGERPVALQLVGMAVAGAGVLLAARASEPDVSTPGGGGPAVPPGTRAGDSAGAPGNGVWLAGVGYGLVAAVALGLLVTFLDASAEGSPLWASLMVRATSVPLFLLAWVFLRGDGRRPTTRDLWVLVVVGLFDNGANVLFAIASQEGLLTLVSVLGSLYPVSTVLLARFVLNERLTRGQVAGVAAAFVGVALIAVA